MFGFGKKKDKKIREKHKKDKSKEKNKKKTQVDKLVMGTIVGVAIGSVVGVSLLPKKKKAKNPSEKKLHKQAVDIREKKKHPKEFTDADIVKNYKKIPNELEDPAQIEEQADE